MLGRWELSDAQRKLIELILRPKRPTAVVGCGRTRGVYSTGSCGVLTPGVQRRELPKKYPAYQTCHRRATAVSSTWRGQAGAHFADPSQGAASPRELQLEEAFIDASFTPQKRASQSG